MKENFRLGKVRILLCTDSASEGLNLQTCGVLINYDMPWNPMRVEQRIGRIDRIGQEFSEVWISNYFYKDTIEDQIYFRLQDRIQWFEVVVGDLQPILAEVGEITRRLAMLSPTDREIELDVEIRKLKNRIQERNFEALDLDKIIQADIDKLAPTSPVTLEQLEYIFTKSPATSTLFTPHHEIENAYFLQWENTSYPVTFSGKVFDQFPDTLRMLTFGTPLFQQILNTIPGIGDEPVFPFVRLASENDIKARQWFMVNGKSTLEIPTVQSLQDNLDKLDVSNPIDIQVAGQIFENTLQRISNEYDSIVQFRRKAEFLTNKKRAQSILIKAALIEIALGLQADMFDTEAYPTVFNEQAITGLQRHGFPWGPLLRLAFVENLSPKEADPYYQKISGENKPSLKAKFTQLDKQAREIIPLLSRLV